MDNTRIPETIPTPSWSTAAERIDLSYEQYEIVTKRIGVGNNAEVHEASVEINEKSHRVALKEPKLSTGTIDRTVLRAISDEADTWNRVAGHPHIVDVLDWGVDEAPWIAVEYMDGGTLADRRSEIGIDQALWIGERLADALYHAVRASTAHLDLTPGNVLFRTTPDGVWDVPKIADWGVARELVARTETIEALTPQYAAPEQFDPEAFPSPDERTDVYQIGTILYELFTGRPPFEGSTKTVIHSVLNKSPTPPTEHEPALPDELDSVLLTALATQPDDRYDSPILLREDITALHESRVESATEQSEVQGLAQSLSVPPHQDEPTTAKQRRTETIAGLGDTYADRLRSVGVDTVRDLAVTDPETVVSATDAAPQIVSRWIAHARSQTAIDPAWLLDDRPEEPVPVTAIEGIGETYAAALASANVETVADLAVAAPRRLAESAELPARSVISWISTARSRLDIPTTPAANRTDERGTENHSVDDSDTGQEPIEVDVPEPESVTAITGIGPVTRRDLRKAGILTVHELAHADAEAVAADLGTDERRVRLWVAEAREIAGPPVDAVAGVSEDASEWLGTHGIETAEQLATCDPQGIAGLLNIPETDAASLIERAEETTYETVSDIRGIGPTYAERLREHGVMTPSDLVEMDPETVGQISEADIGRAERWQRRARKRQ